MHKNYRGQVLTGANFRGQNLNGADFRGATLTNADFSNAQLRGAKFSPLKKDQSIQITKANQANFQGADLRGTNFRKAELRNANFKEIKARLQKRWWVTQLVAALLLAAIAGLASELGGWIGVVFFLSGTENFSVISGIIVLVVYGSYSYILVRHGILASLGAVAGAVAGAGAGAFAGAVAFAFAFAFAGADAFAFLFIGLGIYVSRRAMKGDPKFAIVRSFALAFGTWGGTHFYGADLTDADFSSAHLKSTNFQNAILTRTCWHDAKKLDRARPGNTILSSFPVLQLLVMGRFQDQVFQKANLRGANLTEAKLEAIDLQWAELSEATFADADLRRANLTETLAIGTDFTKAQLTGACIEAWNIDHTTKLDNVDCEFIYLLRNQQERRPSSGDFAAGEFTKLFQEVLSTVDLIFRNGVDWKAFVTAFQQVRVDNEGIPLEIQSIENKGDGVVVVRVSVPPEANKSKIHTEFNQHYEQELKALESRYQTQLQAKETEIAIYREQSANMWGVIDSLANRPINIHAESKIMTNSPDQSQNIKVVGDFTIDATNAVVSLRDISGTVSNTIGQLQTADEPDAPQLADLLTQLQTQIETNPDLDDNAKAKALKHLNSLAQAGQNRSNPTLRETAETALDALTTLLGKAASLVTVALPLLDQVKGLLGFLI